MAIKEDFENRLQSQERKAMGISRLISDVEILESADEMRRDEVNVFIGVGRQIWDRSSNNKRISRA